jgi:hypothetical protein
MKHFLIIILFVGSLQSNAQKSSVVERMKRFHELMIRNDFILDNYIHDSLSYGHSNGWVENAKEFRADLGTVLTYHSIKEDSIVAVESGDQAHIRFVADIDVTLRGVRTQFHLKVLEIWVKKNKQWVLFARQAVKGPVASENH